MTCVTGGWTEGHGRSWGQADVPAGSGSGRGKPREVAGIGPFASGGHEGNNLGTSARKHCEEKNLGTSAKRICETLEGRRQTLAAPAVGGVERRQRRVTRSSLAPYQGRGRYPRMQGAMSFTQFKLLGGSGAFSIMQSRLKQTSSLHRPPVQLYIFSPPFGLGLMLLVLSFGLGRLFNTAIGSMRGGGRFTGTTGG